MEVLFFNSELDKYLASLEEATYSKVLKLIHILEEFGYTIGMPYSKKIADNLYELRVRGKQEVRIFYTFHSQKAYLVHAFIKKSQTTPPKEIGIALKRIKSLT